MGCAYIVTAEFQSSLTDARLKHQFGMAMTDFDPDSQYCTVISLEAVAKTGHGSVHECMSRIHA